MQYPHSYSYSFCKQSARRCLLLGPLTLIYFQACVFGNMLGRAFSLSLIGLEHQRPTIAVLGGDLAAVTATCTACKKSNGRVRVVLLTGGSQVLQNGNDNDDVQKSVTATTCILPDPTWSSQQLIQGFARGGRELAALLAKRCTPHSTGSWLRTLGIELLDAEGDIHTLASDHPVKVSDWHQLQEAFLCQLAKAGVEIQTSVNITNIVVNNSSLFDIVHDQGKSLTVDRLVLAGDDPVWGKTIQVQPVDDDNTTNRHAKSSTRAIPPDAWDEHEPMSRKDKAIQQKKLKRAAKSNKRDDFQAKKRGKVDLETETHGGSSNTEGIIAKIDEMVHKEEASHPTIQAAKLAKDLGHTVESSSIVPGLFSFETANGDSSGLLQGCFGEIAPKVRLRCTLMDPPTSAESKKRRNAPRLPKVEGPLIFDQDTIAGPAALHISSLLANELHIAGYRASLHVHFAPDIGSVQDLEEALREKADSAVSVMSACPLEYREVDYSDYDPDTGDFRSIAYPLVPNPLWTNLCIRAGISSHKTKWKNLSASSLQNLARCIADCPFEVTGIRPISPGCSAAGGVKLQEVSMNSFQSSLIDGLFLCGNALDIHGSNQGCTGIAALATGRVAGTHVLDGLVD